MPAILPMLLPALLPAVADGIRGIIAKFTGSAGAAPQSVAEAIQLMNAETERLKALAALDAPGGVPSLWVVNLRASCRYILGLAIIGVTLLVTMGYVTAPSADAAKLAAQTALVDALLQLSGSVFFYFFGDRVYLKLKNTLSK